MEYRELANRRRFLGLSQAELALRLGVPVNTLARWERGELPIRRGGMLRLALQSIAAELGKGGDHEHGPDWEFMKDSHQRHARLVSNVLESTDE